MLESSSSDERLVETSFPPYFSPESGPVVKVEWISWQLVVSSKTDCTILIMANSFH